MKDYTPTFRGFDSFVGYYNSMEDYWTHYGPSKTGRCSGVDLSNSSGAKDPEGIHAANPTLNGTYSSEIYSGRAAEIVTDHAAHHAGSPLYIYLPFQSVHMPAEAPAAMIAKQAPMKNSQRRTYLGMISAVDAAIGQTVAAMKATGVWDNSVVILNGDNGGPVWCSGMHDCPHAKPDMYGPVSNYPLRSGKWTNWDGGFRVNAFISSPLLPPACRNTTWSGHMHVADIFKTFGALAELPASAFAHAVDSFDMWDAIVSDGRSPRSEVAHLITNRWNVANGLGRWGGGCNVCASGQVPGKSCDNASEPFALDNSTTEQQTGCGGALQIGHMKLLVGFPGDTTLYGLPELTAGSGHDMQASLNALPAYPCQKHCLFNTTADPSETKASHCTSKRQSFSFHSIF